MKSVYRGFDEERGVEVAWNQASLADVLRTPDAVQRMHSEVRLLRELRHDAIIGFHASWVDARRRSFNFITELFSSGTLRAYRLRYPRVSLAAVRSWARQVLRGVAYLHAHDPPVIHRDLKCDNLFVNGHLGQVKIGDLGLAAVLRASAGGACRAAAHSVIGTPEFMAPEMYDEEYDERVDVYAFGMCVLEMVTAEYPYAECDNPAQIYKKVTAGRLPDAFYRVQDDGARRFIGRCLVAAPDRASAAELLRDPFLVDGDDDDHQQDDDQRRRRRHENETCCRRSNDASSSSLSSSLDHDDDAAREQPAARTDMTITGKLNAEEDTVFLKVQIADEETGHVRNIYFPFDMVSDTAAEVASEMVKELDITDRDAAEIAAMIEQEIDRLLPGREQQHEYTYAARGGDDDDENGEERPPPPFCYLSSSPTSSQGSGYLCGVGPYGTRGFYGPHGGGWSKADHWCALSDDDDGASSSSRYSAQHYYEEEGAQSPSSSSPEAAERSVPGNSSSSSRAAAGQAKNTRFGPGRGDDVGGLLERQCSVSPAAHLGRPRQRRGEGGDGRQGRMPRNRSMVDMRSRLLHRTLVEELNRRLFFNTVGAVENIGFRDPASSASSAAARARDGGRGRRRGKDDSHHQYVLL
ncbi:hypothetical protein U9M48_034808 [Paspalum notatum var. saurae]|uniref:non-specific serine/threonine protein kinase n=1 Tax=Paspalum notatum var. saurae TaxID=547442 RepID=A0AAQ3X8A0_PASNO